MAATLNRQRASGSGAQGGAGYVIENSLRFNDNDSAALSRTFGTATDAEVWTFSTWMKRSNLLASGFMGFFGAADTGSKGSRMAFRDDDLEMYSDNAVLSNNKRTDAKFRDPTAWMHICINTEADGTTTGTGGSASIRMWVNGEEQTSFSYDAAGGGTGHGFNSAVAHYVGRQISSASYFDGYLAETIFVDGQRLDPTSFGEFDTNGNFVPIDPSELTFGNNGFWLDFAIAPGTGAGAGKDVSGNTSQAYTNFNGSGSRASSITTSQTIGGFGGSMDLMLNGVTSQTNGMNFATPETVSGKYMKWDFGYAVIIDEAKWYQNGAAGDDLGTWKWQGSNDDSAWTDIGSSFVLANSLSEQSQTELNGNTTEYRYYRLLGVSGSTEGSYWHEEIEFQISGGNDFTESGLAANDQVTDTPTDDADNGIGNACTWNPIYGNGRGYTWVNDVLSNGNTESHGASYGSSIGTLAPATGKYYFELKINDTWGGNTMCGIMSLEDAVFSAGLGSRTRGEVAVVADNGNKFIDGTESSYGNSTSKASGEYVGVAMDLDNGAVWFSENDTWIDGDGTASSSTVKAEIEAGTTTSAASAGLTAGQHYAPFFGKFTNGDQCELVTGLGGSALQGSAPTGFSLLSTANLPAPAVKDPSSDFVLVSDTETNIEATLATARAGWSDYVEIFKNLDASENWYLRFSDDTSNYVTWDTAQAKASFPTLSGSNEFSGMALNCGGVAGFKMGTASHSNGSDTTVTHNAGEARQIVILIPEGTGSRKLYHPDLAAGTLFTGIETNSADSADTTITTVTANSFKIGSAAATDTYRYLIIPDDTGVSSIGTWIGNNSANGPYVFTGITTDFLWTCQTSASEFIMVKDIIQDPHNLSTHYLQQADPAASATAASLDMDLLSSGFKFRAVSGGMNGASKTGFYFSFGRAFGGSGVSQARAR